MEWATWAGYFGACLLTVAGVEISWGQRIFGIVLQFVASVRQRLASHR